MFRRPPDSQTPDRSGWVVTVNVYNGLRVRNRVVVMSITYEWWVPEFLFGWMDWVVTVTTVDSFEGPSGFYLDGSGSLWSRTHVVNPKVPTRTSRTPIVVVG